MTINGKRPPFLNTNVDHYIQKYPYHRLLWIRPEDFERWRECGGRRVYRDPKEPFNRVNQRSMTMFVETVDLVLIKIRPWRYWWYHLWPVRKRNKKIQSAVARMSERSRWRTVIRRWLNRFRPHKETIYKPAPDEYFEENKQAMLDVGFDFEKAEAEWDADPQHKSVRDE